MDGSQIFALCMLSFVAGFGLAILANVIDGWITDANKWRKRER